MEKICAGKGLACGKSMFGGGKALQCVGHSCSNMRLTSIAIMNKPEDQNRPTDPFEAASYDLNKFRERRLADRRFTARGTPDRRVNSAPPTEQGPDSSKQSSH